MKKTLLAAVLMPLLLTCACKKEKDPKAITYPKGPYNSVDELFRQLQPKSKKLTIDAATGASFYGNSGTRYIFAPNSFVTLSGTAVTGNVELEVLECLTKSDMVFSGILPVSNGRPLISGGEIFVTATQGGTELKLKPGTTFTAKMPTNSGAASSGMSVFYGTETGASRDKVNWILPIDSLSLGRIVYEGDTISLISDSLDYVNADKFVSNPDYQTISLNISGLDTKTTAKDIATFVVFDDYNGVTTAGGTYASGVLSGANVARIKVHIAVMAIVDGNFYGGTTPSLTPSTGSSYSVSMSLTTPAAFKSLLDTF